MKLEKCLNQRKDNTIKQWDFIHLTTGTAGAFQMLAEYYILEDGSLQSSEVFFL